MSALATSAHVPLRPRGMSRHLMSERELQMARITHRDLARLLEVLQATNAATDIEAFCQRVAATLPQFIAADLSACLALDASTFQILACAQSPADLTFPEMERLFTLLAKEHPLLLQSESRGGDRALRISDLCPPSQWDAVPIYRAFYRRLGVRHLMGRGLMIGGRTLLWVELGRRHRDFTERDLFLLDLIGPHLEQPGRHAWLIGLLRERRSLVLRATEDIELGIVTLRASGAVREITERGQELLERYFGRGESLPPELSTWVESCLEGRASPDALTEDQRYVFSGPETCLEVRLIRGTGLSLLTLQERPRLDPETQLPLSQREEEVLRLLTQGKSNRAIAEALHTSPRTVGKHLEHIYAKLGVTSRTAAAARAMERAYEGKGGAPLPPSSSPAGRGSQ
jgi:DNA-binding CsgD family transcriptional regulator